MSHLSSPSPQDSDPLLCFETEGEVRAESQEPVVERRPSAGRPEVVAPRAALSDRLDALEKALAASNAEVAQLRSNVATLVRSVDDIRTRTRRPQAEPSRAQRPAGRIASMIAGLLGALVIAGWLWMSNRASAAPIVPAAAVEQLPAADSAAATAPSGETPSPR